MTAVLLWIGAGVVAGLAARWAVTFDPPEWFATTLIAVVGAILAGTAAGLAWPTGSAGLWVGWVLAGGTAAAVARVLTIRPAGTPPRVLLTPGVTP